MAVKIQTLRMLRAGRAVAREVHSLQDSMSKDKRAPRRKPPLMQVMMLLISTVLKIVTVTLGQMIMTKNMHTQRRLELRHLITMLIMSQLSAQLPQIQKSQPLGVPFEFSSGFHHVSYCILMLHLTPLAHPQPPYLVVLHLNLFVSQVGPPLLPVPRREEGKKKKKLKYH